MTFSKEFLDSIFKTLTEVVTASPQRFSFERIKGNGGVQTLLNQSLSASNTTALFHENPEKFSELCVSRAKAKADIIRDSIGSTHGEALEIVAGMCFFSSWRELHEYAKHLKSLPEDQRLSDSRTAKLSFCAIAIKADTQMLDIGSNLIDASACVVSRIVSGTIIEHRHFARDVFSDKSIKDVFFAKDEIAEIINYMHRHPKSYIMMKALSQYTPIDFPKVNGVRDCTMIPTIDLLKSSTFVKTENYMSRHQFSVLISSIVHDVVNEFISDYHHYLYGLMDESFDIDNHVYIMKSRHPGTMTSIRNYVEDLYAIEGLSVQDCLVTPEGAETVFDRPSVDVLKRYMNDRTKVCLDKLPIGNNCTISVFREYKKSETPDKTRFYEIFSIAQDVSGNIIGAVSVDFCRNPYGGISNLGQVIDEFDATESQEMLHAIGTRLLNEGDFWPYEKVAFVFDWRVALNYRRKGIGKLVLNFAFQYGLKGIDNPEVVVATIHPAKYPSAPEFGERNTQRMNYHNDLAEVRLAWSKSTMGSSVFGGKPAEFVEGGFCKHYHGIGNFQIRGYSDLRRMDV